MDGIMMKKDFYRMKEIGARIRRDVHNLWVAAAALIGYDVFMRLVFHAFCPMVILTGLPCPGCGLTRAMVYLMTGRVGQSVQMHPMGIPIACFLLYFLWNRYIRGRRAKGMNALIGITMVLLVFCYVRRMFLFFPDRIPYVYTAQNVFARIFPFYEQVLHEWKILW